MKWSLSKNYKFQLISEHKGDEAGIKSSTIKIEGNYVYGFLKSESGLILRNDQTGGRKILNLFTCPSPILYLAKRLAANPVKARLVYVGRVKTAMGTDLKISFQSLHFVI